ncbi:MAG: aldo/keto reductase [Candidatus Omnitrophica bacterium]|nr:aldo/keto reductase [Candidatus Omnitrophota bacterium]
MNRRDFFGKAAGALAALYASLKIPGFGEAAGEFETMQNGAIPKRDFGKTGVQVTIFGLGGEGILRTYGRKKEAVPVIERALDLGVNYFDTAPAYSESQDYYGAVFRSRPGARDGIFLASKTHDRMRKGSLRLLDDSLERLGTDHLDLWQLHDLREQTDLDEIFSKDGAIHALEEARKSGKVRFLGITGHHDPKILKAAAERYDFDSVLAALNVADRTSHSFIEEFLPVAKAKGMGVIGMKVYSRGRILEKNLLTPKEALNYVLSLAVSHIIIGCDNVRQVEENVSLAKQFKALSEEEMSALENRVTDLVAPLTYYKGHW